jgi:ferredoxin
VAARDLTGVVDPRQTSSADPGAPPGPESGAAPGVVFPASALDQLLDAIRRRGFRLVGPVVKDGAICYGDIGSAADLPAGWTDEQDAGRYRLRRRDDGALFGYAVGPHSWKKYLFPPSARLLPPEEPPERPFAFIGVRACELTAIAIQDRVFLGGHHKDQQYESRRQDAFIVAVNCGEAGGTCFCVSMDAGPRATQGFDIALTELLGQNDHRFLAEAGTTRGAEILTRVRTRPAHSEDIGAASAATENAVASMGRVMPQLDLRALLEENFEHPRWDDVAARCLTCGNCTMVCPTCFCFSVEDVSGLSSDSTTGDPERHRSWDSCFTIDHSYLHSGSVRVSDRSRYRQWMTHKLATWIDQFGTSGCVGCGRCITWCPAGIDITEEVAAIAADS